MTIWKKKPKIQRLRKFIKDLILFIKGFCCVWKYTGSKNPKVVKTKTEKWSFYQNVQWDSKKSKFIKEKNASGLFILLRNKGTFK